MSVASVSHEEFPRERYLPCVSAAMQTLAASVARVAATDAPVLICGETGTGKSTLAWQVYEDGPWRAAPLIVLHGATTTARVVSDLAALAERMVLLEDLGDLAPAAQDSLVHLLAVARPRLRFVATTVHELAALAARQVIRPDLLYRLDVIRLNIPPLRERPEDILFLAEHFLSLAARHFHRELHRLTPEAQARLVRQPWIGNLRELRNCMLESVLRCSGRVLRAADLHLREAPVESDPVVELTAALTRMQQDHPRDLYARIHRILLEWALATCEGNHIRAAALLGIGRGSLRAKLRRHGLDRRERSLPS